MIRLSIRVDLDPAGRLGPGKIELLEQVAKSGSIAAAGRAMGMSYRRAWELIDDVNALFREPLVTKQSGGNSGGGAALTPLGRKLVAKYRAIERDAHRAALPHLRALQKSVRAKAAS